MKRPKEGLLLVDEVVALIGLLRTIVDQSTETPKVKKLAEQLLIELDKEEAR